MSNRLGLGLHWLIEANGCDRDSLSNVEGIQAAFNHAALTAGMTIIHECYHRFEPWGVSGATVVAESHLAVHTWPEYDYAAIDIFVCADNIPIHVILDDLRSHFKWKEIQCTLNERGIQAKMGDVIAAWQLNSDSWDYDEFMEAAENEGIDVSVCGDAAAEIVTTYAKAKKMADLFNADLRLRSMN